MVLYKNDPDKFKLTKGTILSLSSIYLILTVGIFLLIYFQTDQVHIKYHIKYYVYIIIGITEISILGFIFFNMLKKLKHSYLNYILTIQEDVISCTKQSFIPTISIPKSEISAIIEDQHGNLTIKGSNPKIFIYILPYLEHLDEVKLQLSAIKPITLQDRNKNIFEKFPQILIIMMGCMVAIYLSYNKILVAITGTITIGLLSWFFYSMQKNKQLDKKLKRNSWWVLVVLFSVIAIIYYKVFVL